MRTTMTTLNTTSHADNSTFHKEQPFVLFDEEAHLMTQLCERLCSETLAHMVFLIDKNGQLLASSGHIGTLDTTSLSSLCAGHTAASLGLAKLIGESSFVSQFNEGTRMHYYSSVILERAILVLVFGSHSTLGLVRLRVKKIIPDFVEVVKTMIEKSKTHRFEIEAIEEITEEDIDNLFKM